MANQDKRNNDATSFETTCPACGGKAVVCGDTVTCERCEMLATLREIDLGDVAIKIEMTYKAFSDPDKQVEAISLQWLTFKAVIAKLISQQEEIKDHAKWAKGLLDDPKSKPYRILQSRLERLIKQIKDSGGEPCA